MCRATSRRRRRPARRRSRSSRPRSARRTPTRARRGLRRLPPRAAGAGAQVVEAVAGARLEVAKRADDDAVADREAAHEAEAAAFRVAVLDARHAARQAAVLRRAASLACTSSVSPGRNSGSNGVSSSTRGALLRDAPPPATRDGFDQKPCGGPGALAAAQPRHFFLRLLAAAGAAPGRPHTLAERAALRLDERPPPQRVLVGEIRLAPHLVGARARARSTRAESATARHRLGPLRAVRVRAAAASSTAAQ